MSIIPVKENLANNIRLIEPGKRLAALNSYMRAWIDEWPRYSLSFNEFLLKKFRRIIPGAVEYYREIATHCFYCNRPYSTTVDAFKKTIDHWTPKSKGGTEKYVICCFDCNNNKANSSPIELIAIFIKASMTNRTIWGYHGKKLSFIAGQLQIITNDILYNMGPTVYYFKR